MVNDVIERVADKFVEELDNRSREILEKYFGKIPKEYDNLRKWFQEKRNIGYVFNHLQRTVGEYTVHELEIKLCGEIVLKEVMLIHKIIYA